MNWEAVGIISAILLFAAVGIGLSTDHKRMATSKFETTCLIEGNTPVQINGHLACAANLKIVRMAP